MHDILPIESAFNRALIAITITIFSYSFYLFGSYSPRVKKRIRRSFNRERTAIRQILFRRILGGGIFMILPWLCICFLFRQSLAEYGLNLQGHGRSLRWLIPALPVILAFNYFASRWHKNLAVYPQIRKHEWGLQLFLFSAAGWIFYLAAYEFMFRGFLLFACLEAFGYWPALILNVIMYSLAHIPKGREEMIGSLILGFIFCTSAIELGNIWFALIAHIVFALVNEWFSLAFQPDMRLIINGRNK